MSLRQSQSSRSHDAGSHNNPQTATAGGGAVAAGAGPSGGAKNAVAPHVSGSIAAATAGQAASTKGPGAANAAAVATSAPGAAGGGGGGPGGGKKRECVCPLPGCCIVLYLFFALLEGRELSCVVIGMWKQEVLLLYTVYYTQGWFLYDTAV